MIEGRINIIHIATDDSTGGAARAARRLHIGLRRLGNNSIMFVAHRTTDDSSILELHRASSPFERLLRAVNRHRILKGFSRYRTVRPGGFEPFSQDRSELGDDLVSQVPACDVINLHWVAGFIDYVSFFEKVPKRTPIVWTLHDMNVFTGGCHYDDGCGKYIGSCGACPQLGSRKANDLSRQVWLRKMKAFTSIPPGRMHVVADSRWLAAEAARSSLLGKFPISWIHYGLDVETFAPRNKLDARSVLGIPAEASVIMFAADLATNRRKGLATLADALGAMANSLNLLLLSVGRGTPVLPTAIPHMHFGSVGSDLLLSVLYSAADVFVIPSVQEAFGQTALEAMACGTPVIGSKVGGIPEIVCDGITGYLVPPLDPAKLREALINLLGDPKKRAEMSINCRRIAVQEHTLEVQAQRYSQLYEEIFRRGADGSGRGPAIGRAVAT